MAALRLLDRAESVHAGGAFVFPSITDPDKPYASFPKAWRRMIEAAMTPHGLRHAFASAAHDLGYSELTIGALLGHAKSGVTAGYIHHADRLLLDAADRVAGFIWGAMVGEADRVVRFEAKERAHG
jgi:integrase